MSLILDQSMSLEGYGDFDFFGPTYLTQIFKSGVDGELKQIKINLYKLGTPPNFIVEIRDVVDGKPGSTIYVSQEKSGALVSTSHAEITIAFTTPYSIIKNTLYAIVLRIKNDGGDSDNKYFNYGVTDDTYLDGPAGTSVNSGTSWTMVSWLDLYFKTYIDIPNTPVLDQSMLLEGYGTPSFYGPNYIAQTFKAGISGPLSQIKFFLGRVGNPSNLIIEICNVVDGKPGTTIYVSKEIPTLDINTSMTATLVTFYVPLEIEKNTSYAIVLRTKTGTEDVNNRYLSYYVWDTEVDHYVDGTMCNSGNSGVDWNQNSTYTDLFFAIYVFNFISPFPSKFRV